MPENRSQNPAANQSARFLPGKSAFALLSLLLSGCASDRQGDSSPSLKPVARLILSTNSVPFELEDTQIVVRGTLNGISRDVRYALDTGAAVVFLSPPIAAAAGIRGATRVEINGFGPGTGTARQSTADSITIGPASVREVPLVIMPLPSVLPADAVLGLSFLNQFVYHLDYQRKLLTFARPDDHILETGTALPMQLQGEYMTVEAEVDGARATLAIDTGANQALLLRPSFVRQQRMRERYPNRLKILTGLGILGEIHGELARVESLKLGPFTFTNLVVEFGSKDDLGPETIAGFLGAEVLGCFNLTFDMPGQRLWIAPNENFGRPLRSFASIRSGLVCLPAGTNMVVRQVIPKSPAAQAGVRVGDRVRAIDGKPTQMMTFVEIKRAFQASPGTTVRLQLESPNEPPRETLLVLRELL